MLEKVSVARQQELSARYDELAIKHYILQN